MAATGGTVTAGGATLIIPPGSLAQDTTITVKVSSPSSSLPERSTVAGLVYDFGPDGTSFSTPATLTLPMVGTPAANERAVVSSLDPIADRWVDTISEVAGARVNAPVSHFTDFVVRFQPLKLTSIYRQWWFEKMNDKEQVRITEPADCMTQPLKCIDGFVEDNYDFGPIAVIPPGFDQDAKAKVYSNDTGRTYWVSAQAPRDSDAHPDAVGSVAVLHQTQYFEKQAANATLRVVLTAASMDAIDLDGHDATVEECPWLTPQMAVTVACARVMWGSVNFTLEATSYTEETKTYFTVGGSAEINGWDGNWGKDAWTDAGSSVPLWSRKNFVLEEDVDGPESKHARVRLIAAIPIDVPVSSIGIGKTVSVYVHAQATAINDRKEGERGSYVSAFLRDPVDLGGVTFSYEGLAPIPGPPGQPPAAIPEPAPPCTTGLDPAAGTLQFDAAGYAEPELPGRSPGIVVTRSGGSRGAASARVMTSDGTAVGGVDYTPVTTQVLFADGEEGSRIVHVAIPTDSIAEPDRTVNLTLSEPGGCATMGAQTSTVLTILDDDRPPVLLSFTIGGTVVGLVGTGLVLQNLGGDDLNPGNGPFAFTLRAGSGAPYNVTVAAQPTNPGQVCTVTNGSGAVGTANVADVTVTCETTQASPGLDPGFGSGGKVTAGLTGGATAMALQADGKIILALRPRPSARSTTTPTDWPCKLTGRSSWSDRAPT